MQRNTGRDTHENPLANLTWRTMDLVFGPLRETVAFTRSLVGRRAARGASTEPSDESEAVNVDAEEVRDETDGPGIEEVWGVGSARAPELRERGLYTIEDIAEAELATLEDLPGVGEDTAARIRYSAVSLLGEDEE